MDDLMPVAELSRYQEMAVTWLAAYGAQLVLALLIVVVGLWIGRRVRSLVRAALGHRKVDPLLVQFLGNLVYWALAVAVFLAAVSRIGVDTTSFLAVVGSLGLAIGLAMKDNLSNVSSGVMLILLRPFTLGDYIEVAGVQGTVQAISLTTTVLVTPDNQRILVPNTKITGEIIRNVTANDTRRIDLVVGIGYGDDAARAKAVVAEVLAAEPRVLAEPAPQIAVAELADSSVNLVVRPWVRTDEYWPTRFDLTEKLKTALDAAGISIPFPQREVHVVSRDN
ncbi:mechanosensitive ion channel family protein [Desulfocurvus sp.]|jgi:small conductance mechanosensitive channel|uniref:mechanosensitive ion channel family protein n=1 Tax=Desulfocurvus sp. TaxID=2871698 RepID=UPI0025BB8FAA|nr:mechanosensitive ion channel family protein [Desulfocurvus sp.]MCK9240749.1 mechanosensitive ion channel family protein [Desulfocurvus sp.]